MTPHFGVAVLEKDGTEIRKLKYKKKNGIVSEKTSETMRILLKSVVEEGSGKNGYIEGYSIGGKTAAPVLRSIYDNVLPYLGIEKN